MKIFNLKKTFPAVVALALLALATLSVVAQESPTNSAPPLAYGVPQILQLEQAKVTDDIIIAYIHNSTTSYGLDADQIIYLRQQGISDKVLTAMLTQPKPGSVPTPTTPAPAEPYPMQTPITYPEPAPAYDQSSPSSSVYTMPNNQIYYYSSYYPYYYYPYYYYYYPYYPYYRYHPYYHHYAWNRSSMSGGFHGGNFRGGTHNANVGMSFHGGSFHGGNGGGMMMNHGGNGGGMMMNH
jgi:hypothetical protein